MSVSRRRFVGTAVKCLCGVVAVGVMPVASAAGKGWQYSCGGLGGGHPFTSGPIRKTYKDAVADGKSHDKAKHGGTETAVVFEIPA